MADFEYTLYTTHKEGNIKGEEPRQVYFHEICETRIWEDEIEELDESDEINFHKLCKRTVSPLDFVYNEDTGEYDLTPYNSDEELLKSIQSGHRQHSTSPIYLESFIGGAEPSDFEQDTRTGQSNIVGAKAAIVTYYIEMWRVEGLDYGYFRDLDYEIQAKVDEINGKSDVLKIH